MRLSAAEKSATRAALPLRSADVELRTSLTDPVRHSLTPQNVSDETPLQDDRNYAVFKRLLQTGATLDEIVAEMRVAGVPPETTDRIVDSLRSIVATRSRHSAEDQSPAPNLIAPAAPTVPSSDGGNPRAAVLAMITKRSSPSCSGDGATNAVMGGAGRLAPARAVTEAAAAFPMTACLRDTERCVSWACRQQARGSV